MTEINSKKEVGYKTNRILDLNIIDRKIKQKTKIRNIIIFILLLILILASFILFFGFNKIKVRNYEVGIVKRGIIQDFLLFEGIVESNKTYFIQAPFSGTVKKIYVKLGEQVDKNIKIATLASKDLEQDLEDFENELNSLHILLDEEKINLKILKLNSQKEINNYSKQILELEEEIEINKKLRYEISAYDLKKMENKLNSLINDYNIYKEISELEIEKCKIKIRNIEANINVLNDKIIKYNKKLSARDLFPLMKSIISDTFIKEGSYITENSNCFKLEQMDTYALKIKIPQNKIDQVKKEQPVLISFDNKETIPGTISEIYYLVKSDYIDAYITPDISLDTILPGIKFVAKVILLETTDVLILPRGDYISETQMKFVFKTEEASKSAKKVPISIGLYDDENIEITSGLNEGDKVIISSYKKFFKLNEIALE